MVYRVPQEEKAHKENEGPRVELDRPEIQESKDFQEPLEKSAVLDPKELLGCVDQVDPRD